ncbi:MAG TPA: nitronate monooxygenase [Nocardioidaceae bacterium]|nr:nitronate monooxygenase [Nocardioidaceae bacterium]
MIRTWLTDRFDLRVALVGAPMAGPGDGRLAAAVSQAGALGMVGVGAARTPAWIAEQAAIAAAPGRRFGFGLMAWALEERPEQLDAVLDAGPALVSVSFGNVAPHVGRIRDAGVAAAVQAGTVEEAVAAEAAGASVVVARGAEAGGHGRDAVGTLALLQALLDRLDVPVLAAGGIGTARGLAAVLAAGATGAWVGTALLGCPEAANSATARQRLFAAEGTDTRYGRVFDVAQRLGWPPEYGGRALGNAFFERWRARLDELAGDDAAAEELAAARAAEDYDTAYLYAGQGVGLLREERPVADVIAELARVEELLAALPAM